MVFRAARGARPPAHPERRQFRARPVPRSAKECRCGVRVFAVTWNPDPQDERIWSAATSEDFDRYRSGNGNRGGGLGGIHGRPMGEKLFGRVALIGIGLIGSSLARALRRDSPETEIIACARRAETLAAVRRLAIADATTHDPAQAAAGGDLVVIATPLSSYAEIGMRIAPVLKADAILTDVGSVKRAVIRDLQPHVPAAVHFVPGHPVAGTEHS